jgi:hypothetical protein
VEWGNHQHYRMPNGDLAWQPGTLDKAKLRTAKPDLATAQTAVSIAREI